eukprot:2960102-Pyramimonas_sp.AAC.2
MSAWLLLLKSTSRCTVHSTRAVMMGGTCGRGAPPCGVTPQAPRSGASPTAYLDTSTTRAVDQLLFMCSYCIILLIRTYNLPAALTSKRSMMRTASLGRKRWSGVIASSDVGYREGALIICPPIVGVEADNKAPGQ